jgi:hypothetical protein
VDGRRRGIANCGELCDAHARRRVAGNAAATASVAEGAARELLQRAALPCRPEGLDVVADAAAAPTTSALAAKRQNAAPRARRLPLVRLARVRASLRPPVWTAARDEYVRGRRTTALMRPLGAQT